MRDALAQRLEQLSAYEYISATSANSRVIQPLIAAYRRLDLRGAKYYVLTSIRPCGLDFTARTNHIAHHLVFEEIDLSRLPSPASILRHWPGWRASWDGEPRRLDELPLESFARLPQPSLPALTWLRLTGDPRRAAALVECDPAAGVNLVSRPGNEAELLELFAESLRLINPNGRSPARAWDYTFTAALQSTDQASEFCWRGYPEGSPAWDQVARRSATVLPVSALALSNTGLARLARDGQRAQPAFGVPPAPVSPATPKLQFHRSGLEAKDLATRRGALSARRAAPTLAGRRWLKPALLTVCILVGLLGLKFLAGSGKSNPSAIPAAVIEMTNSVARGPGSAATRESTPPPAADPSAVAAPQSSAAPAVLSAAAARLPGQTASPPRWASLNWDAAPIYVVLAPALNGDPISLPDIPPLQSFLRRLDGLDIRPNEFGISICQGSWSFPIKLPARIQPLKSDHRLAWTETEIDHVVCELEYGDWLVAEKPVRLQLTAEKELRALSVLVGPQRSQENRFDPFRLLLVNVAQPPAPLRLSLRFLKRGWSLQESIDPDLWARLRSFQLTNASWQLRPYVQKDGAVRDLFATWPASLQPDPDKALDLPFVKAQVTNKLTALQRRLVASQARPNEPPPPPADLSRPIGSLLLAITNGPFVNFIDYQLAQRRTEASPELYQQYLGQLAAQGRTQRSWLGDWEPTQGGTGPDVEQDLRRLYELCATHLTPAGTALLSASPAETNLFLATWRWLRWGQDQVNRDRETQTLQQELESAAGRLREVPDSLDQLAFVSLLLVAGERRLEVIRFSHSSQEDL
jgi:hypothetical protein